MTPESNTVNGAPKRWGSRSTSAGRMSRKDKTWALSRQQEPARTTPAVWAPTADSRSHENRAGLWPMGRTTSPHSTSLEAFCSFGLPGHTAQLADPAIAGHASKNEQDIHSGASVALSPVCAPHWGNSSWSDSGSELVQTRQSKYLMPTVSATDDLTKWSPLLFSNLELAWWLSELSMVTVTPDNQQSCWAVWVQECVTENANEGCHHVQSALQCRR
jgi:hypothetical protein